jgi:acyl-CoA synthetase (NDP forming)
VVDAFFERHAIWRAEDPHELVSAAALYLSGRRPRGRRLVFISNSGASCVMAADYAERAGLALAEVSEQAKQKMRQVLPPFAGLDNPIDVTGALLGNPKLFSAVLPAVGEDARSDLLVVALPVAGTGYDVPGLAEDLRQFCERYDHAARLRKRVPELREAQIALPQGGGRFLDEAQSLAALARAGLPVVEHRLCRNAAEAAAAARLLGPEIVMKACSPDLPHKSDHGLVCLSVAEPETEFHRQADVARTLGARFEGVIVARKAAKGRELALGARVDPQFGPVVLVGDGGVYLEALKDYRLLVPPFDEEEVADKLRELRIAPLLGAWRGEPARDVQAFAGMARRLGEAITAWGGAVAAVDVNPVMVFETGRGALAVDALIERAV